jgi:hypothetical protein
MLFVAMEVLPKALADCIHGAWAFGWQIRMKQYAEKIRFLGGLGGLPKGCTRCSEPVGQSSFSAPI